jgi:hypothetical protein
VKTETDLATVTQTIAESFFPDASAITADGKQKREWSWTWLTLTLLWMVKKFLLGGRWHRLATDPDGRTIRIAPTFPELSEFL